jgi:uncharacterized RDD family membrane protein YckC
MNCPLCGEVCRCHPEPPPPVSSTTEPQAAGPNPANFEVGTVANSLKVAADEVLGDKSEVSGGECDIPEEDSQPDPDAWRGELSERLNRYRARRKMRPPRYPSLSLTFGPVHSPAAAPEPQTPARHPYEVVSDHALALNDMRIGAPVEDTFSEPAEMQPASVPTAVSVPHTTAKIIEFPRFAWAPPTPPDDQLAGPVGNVPRILDVPEMAPPPPALGGILIEPAERQELERRPGIDIPLQSASLSRRLAASAIDWVIVGSASVVFALIFWKFSTIRPPRVTLAAMAVGVPMALWFAYHYLMIVYGASTPGLRMAGLQLSRFDGSMPNRRTRRSRILASLLSAVSLGMGYAWVFLDEDVLCWHDRITHTYLAPVKKFP